MQTRCYLRPLGSLTLRHPLRVPECGRWVPNLEVKTPTCGALCYPTICSDCLSLPYSSVLFTYRVGVGAMIESADRAFPGCSSRPSFISTTGGASCFPILSKRISAWCSVYTPAGQHMKSRHLLRPGHLQVSKSFQGWLTVLQTLPMASHLQHPLNHLPYAALGLLRASWI